AVDAAARDQGCRVVGGIRVSGILTVGGVQRAPGDAARAAQADAPGLVAAAARGVVARGRSAALVQRVRGAVQEVTVLIDTQAEITAVQAVVWGVRVRAGVAQAAAPSTQTVAIAGRLTGDRARVELAGVHEKEADA